MRDLADPIIILPGAGGGTLNPAMFRADDDNKTSFETIGYPSWRRYIEDGFSAEILVSDK